MDKHPVIVIKTLRLQRLRQALQRSAQAVHHQEQSLRQAQHLHALLVNKQHALQQHRSGFSGSGGDLLACDAALLATDALVATASATAGLRQAELRQMRATHVLRRQRWHAAQEGLRLATERLRLQARRNGALRAVALEEDLAEARACARLGTDADTTSLQDAR